MSRRWRLFIVQPLLALVLVLLIIVAGLALLAMTETGTVVIGKLAERAIPKLALQGVDGSLVDGISVESIMWDEDETQVSIDQARIRAKLLVTFPPTLEVGELTADRITLDLPVNEPNPYSPREIRVPNWRLPVNVDLQSVAVNELLIQQAGQQFRIQNARLKVRSQDGVLNLSDLQGSLLETDGQLDLTLSGTLGLKQPFPINLVGGLSSNAARLGVGNLALSMQGHLSEYTLGGSGSWQWQQLPETEVELAATGGLDRLTINSLTLNDDVGELAVKGDLGWVPGLNWSIAGRAKDFNLGGVNPNLAGALDFALTSTGEITEQRKINAKLTDLEGEVQDLAVSGGAEIAIKGKAIQLKNADIIFGDNHLTAQGREPAENSLGFEWELKATKLEQLNNHLAGKLIGQGAFAGAVDGQSMHLTLESLQGEVNGRSIDAKGSLRIDDGVLSAEQVEIALSDNVLTLDGVANKTNGLDWMLDAKELSELNPNLSGVLAGSGQVSGLVDGSDVDFSVTSLQGEVNDFPIAVTGAVQKQGEIISAQDLTLSVGENQIVLNGKADEADGLVWRLAASQLNQLNPNLNGYVKGNGALFGLLDGSQVGIQIDDLAGELNDFPLSVEGGLQKEGEQLSANDLRLYLGDNKLTLNGVSDESNGLAWSLDADELEQVYAEIRGDLSGQGQLKGLLDGSQFFLDIGQLAGEVNGFQITAKGALAKEGEKIAAEDLAVTVGDNKLVLNGAADQRTGMDWQLDANQLSDLSEKVTGRLFGQGNLKGLLDGSQWAVRVDDLSGQVMGFPVDAKGDIAMEGGIIEADDLSVALGDNRILLNGHTNESTGLAWQLTAKKLSQISPKIKGTLNGNGIARGRLNAKNWSVEIDDLKGRLMDYPVAAKGDVEVVGQKLVADGLELAVGPNRLTLDGDSTASMGVDWSLNASDLSVFAPQIKGDLKGAGKLEGALDGSRAKVAIKDLTGNIQNFPVSATGLITRAAGGVSVKDLQLALGANFITVSGQVLDRLALDWQLDAQNLSQIPQAPAGNLKGAGRITGDLASQDFEVEVADIAGQLMGKPLRSQGKLVIKEGKITAKQLVVASGNNRVTASGKLTEPFDLSWQVDAKGMHELMPGLSGSLVGQGRLVGRLPMPALNGDLRARSLKYQNVSIGDLQLSASGQGAQQRIKLTAQGVQQGTNIFSKVDGAFTGTPESHQLNLQASHNIGQIQLGAHGSWRDAVWQGRVHQLEAKHQGTGLWRLTQPAALKFSSQGVNLSRNCVANGRAQFCQEFSRNQAGHILLKGQIQQMPFGLFQTYIPEGWQMPGQVQGEYQIQVQGGKPRGELALRLPDSSLVLPISARRKETIPYKQGRATIRLHNDIARVDGGIDLVGKGNLRAQGDIRLAGPEPQLNLTAKINAPKIDWVQRYLTGVSNLAGRVSGEITLNGPLSKPHVRGRASLDQASLRLDETGANLQDIRLQLTASQPDQIGINGSLRAGPGQLKTTGNIDLRRLPEWQAQATVQGQNLRLMNTHEVQGHVSPQLNIKASPKGMDLTGRVVIPDAVISLREIPVGTNVRSDDIVIVGGGRKPPEKKAQGDQDSYFVRPNIQVELGQKVRFNGFGLEAGLGGKVRIARNRQGIVSEGQLLVQNGIYRAYGQDLSIGRGRILFNGPPDNPGLDVEATRTIDTENQVGIRLGGSIRKPSSTLFSNSDLNQSDTLSYLLTGRSLSSASGQDSAILTQAITGLGIAGGENLMRGMASSIGLDDVGLNTVGGDYKQSELSLGKRLGPNLYVKYIVGLFDSLQKIAVTYDINQKLQVEAKSGLEQSIDLIYNINSDTGFFGGWDGK